MWRSEFILINLRIFQVSNDERFSVSSKAEVDAAVVAFMNKLTDRYPALAGTAPLMSTDPREIGEFVVQNGTDGARMDWLTALSAISATGSKLSGPGLILRAIAGGITGLAVMYGIFISPSFFKDMAEPGNARGLITFLLVFATIAVVIITVIATFWMKIEEVEKRDTMAKEILAGLIGIMGTTLGFYFGSAKPEVPNETPQVTVAPTPPAG